MFPEVFRGVVERSYVSDRMPRDPIDSTDGHRTSLSTSDRRILLSAAQESISGILLCGVFRILQSVPMVRYDV